MCIFQYNRFKFKLIQAGSMLSDNVHSGMGVKFLNRTFDSIDEI